MPVPTRYGPVLGRFADFSRGEYGALGGRRAQAGQWTGLNVGVYLDGSIGPRAGLLSATPAPDTFDIFHTAPTPAMLIGRERGGAQRLWVLGDNDLVYGAAYSAGTWSVYSGAVLLDSGGTSIVDAVDDSTDTYITSFAQGTFKVDHAAAAISLLTDSPGGRCITIFGEHLVVGGVSGAENQIRFSKPNDYDTWDPLDFIGMGHPGDVIKSLQVQHNVLVIQTDHGDIYTVSGTLAVNDSLRRVTSIAPRIAALNGQRVGVTKRNVIWRRGRNAVPESFDGAQLRNLTHLNNWTVSSQAASQIAIVPGADDDDILFFGGFGALLQLHNGAWSKHALAVFAPAATGIYACYDGDSFALIATNGNAGGVHVYKLALGLERPPVASLGDTVEDMGVAAPVAGFTTPELRDSAGRGMHPRAVQVRFTKYLSGGVQTNHFDVTLNVHDVYETTQRAAPPAQSFDEANASATTAGVRQEKLFAFDAGEDVAAVSVTIGNLRGIKIDEIVVYGEVVKPRST